MGTGSIIKSYNETFSILSAKHNFVDSNKTIHYGQMFQGLGQYGNGFNQLATGRITKVCFSDKNRDLAIAYGTYDKDHKISREIVNRKTTEISDTCVNGIGTIRGYTLGEPNQRYKSGVFDCLKSEHFISTQPGDSGAGVFNSNNELIGVHTGSMKEKRILDVILEDQDKRLYLYESNNFLKVSKKDIENEFTSCYEDKRINHKNMEI